MKVKFEIELQTNEQVRQVRFVIKSLKQILSVIKCSLGSIEIECGACFFVFSIKEKETIHKCPNCTYENEI